MLLLDQGLVLFVDDGLMVLVDVFLNDDWLMMFMDNFLMMFMEDVLPVLNIDIFVMFMNDILMDFFDDGLSDLNSHISGEFVSFDGLAFIGLLEHSLFLMGDDNWLLVDLFHDGFTYVCSWGSESCGTMGVDVLRCSSDDVSLLVEIGGTSSAKSGGLEISVSSSSKANSSSDEVLVLTTSGDDIFFVVYVL